MSTWSRKGTTDGPPPYKNPTSATRVNNWHICLIKCTSFLNIFPVIHHTYAFSLYIFGWSFDMSDPGEPVCVSVGEHCTLGLKLKRVKFDYKWNPVGTGFKPSQ